MKKHFILLSLLLSCALLPAQTAPAPNRPDTGKAAKVQQNGKVRPERKGRKNQPANRVMNSRMKYLTEKCAEILKRYDKNGNGKLDSAEKQEMEKAFNDAHAIYMLSLSYRSIQAVDLDGDMKFSEEELKNGPERIRKMHAERRQKMQARRAGQRQKMNQNKKAAPAK